MAIPITQRELRNDSGEIMRRVEAGESFVDDDAARAYGRIYARVTAQARKAGGRRAVDLLIAATALGVELPVVTCNPDDFAGLEGLVDVHAVEPPSGVGPGGSASEGAEGRA
jgi:predicted nucleic acid-binding protein